MSANDFEIIKDEENDIIYVIKSNIDKEKTINICATENITLRKKPETNEVIGLTIEDFSKVLPQFAGLPEYHLMERFEGIIEFLNAPNLAIA